MLACAVVVTSAATACGEKKKSRDCQGPPPPGPGGLGFAGGGTTPEMGIALQTTAGVTVVAYDGISMPIVAAPQGGFITLAGVRARNLDECVDMTAALRDEADGNRIVSLEQRPAQLVLGSDGWLTPLRPEYLFNWANMPACPAGASADFHGRTYLLEVSVVDRAGRSAFASAHVVPTCDPLVGEYCLDNCVLGTAGALARR